ncbi:endolytic transglycosylase MltG [Acetobacter sacchari]|uniref:Endolytic murein transglycosylase n=1 Tax=Acetobacter sacchari TaxID=2661687 RepID=A0ABS3LUI8_9PROT|nr:endolytic transglycosylase MltG [Acetobacter sacchari]MBO1359571.1 endolytic transglycosylase MltG [Acetobacter sacchari]
MSSSKKVRRFRRSLAVLAVFVAVCAATAGACVWRYRAPGPLPAQAAIVIPHGGYSSTIRALQGQGVLPAGWFDTQLFRLAIAVTRHDGQLHAAELEFPAAASMKQILHVLRHGQPVRHWLTIPEGLTSRQIAALVNAAPFLAGTVAAPMEGGIAPQTYDYLRGVERSALLDRMRAAMEREVAEVWAGRDADLSLKTPEEMVTLASIVEKETAVPEERPHIARVFLNRLRLGMKLQADPTTIYAANDGAGPLGRPLTHADLAFASPYNTYVSAGLPPGPICSPGLASLQAVAHPASGEDLYFVASGEGGHRFAASLAEHNRNVALMGGSSSTEKTEPKP